jgi:hypothetical protein
MPYPIDTSHPFSVIPPPLTATLEGNHQMLVLKPKDQPGKPEALLCITKTPFDHDEWVPCVPDHKKPKQAGQKQRKP